MPYIQYESTQDKNVLRVFAILYNPFPEQIIGTTGEEIEDVPAPDDIPNMKPTLYFRRDTKELFYHYEEFQAPPETKNKIEELEIRLSESEAATIEMYEGQLIQDARIAEANAATLELYELIAQGGMV